MARHALGTGHRPPARETLLTARGERVGFFLLRRNRGFSQGELLGREQVLVELAFAALALVALFRQAELHDHARLVERLPLVGGHLPPERGLDLAQRAAQQRELRDLFHRRHGSLTSNPVLHHIFSTAQ